MTNARTVHPGAWWGWAVGIAVLAARTTSIPVLLAALATVAVVVTSCREPGPLSRSLGFFARVAVAIVLFRLALQIAVGVRIPGTTLFTLPSVELPTWMAGINLGGPVTLEALLAALGKGLQLAVIIVAVGSASSLASPARLLRALPRGLYEVGVVISVALTLAPQMVLTVADVRTARLLRGRPTTGLAGLRGMTVPVLEGALDRSLELAATMDSRGFGRHQGEGTRWRGPVVAVAGVAIVVGAYQVLGPASGAGRAVGTALLFAGAALSAAATLSAGRGRHRTRYRPLRWTMASTAVLASGAALAITGFAADLTHPGWGHPSGPGWEMLGALPWPILLGAIVAMTPAWIAPTAAAGEGR